MGVSGASLATAVSQLSGWCVLLWGTSRPGNVHIKFKNFSPTLYYYKEITRGGLPSLARQALSVVATISLNRMAVHYALPGNEASTVAAFTIVSRITLFCFAIVIGFGQGFQPVCGYNYGAKLYARVKESYQFCITISTSFLIVLGTVVYIFAPDMISWFRGEDPELIRVGSQALRWQCIAKKTFTPEFVNRVDDIIFFRMLGKDSLIKIVDILMKQVGKRIKDLGMDIELTESAKELLAKKGYDPQYGARPLRRVITSMVEDRFSEAMLDGIVKPGHLAIIDAVETSDPEALLAQGSAAEDGKVIVIKDGGELEKSDKVDVEEPVGSNV